MKFLKSPSVWLCVVFGGLIAWQQTQIREMRIGSAGIRDIGDSIGELRLQNRDVENRLDKLNDLSQRGSLADIRYDLEALERTVSRKVSDLESTGSITSSNVDSLESRVETIEGKGRAAERRRNLDSLTR